MKKIVLALILFLPVSAHAAAVGCFVENGSLYCSNANVTCDLNPANNYVLYGQTLGYLCDLYLYGLNESINLEDSLAQCNAAYNSAYNQAGVNFNAYRKQASLVGKLKRACGSKCKGIK